MKYQDYKDFSFSIDEEKRFRDSLNSYCNNEDFFDNMNLGDVVEILHVSTAPIYRVSLTSQYDNRIINIAEEPTNIEYVPAITDISQIDIWSKIPISSKFENFTKYYKILQSRKTVICPSCKNGKITCPTCNGSGTNNVVVTSKCNYCNGKGYVEKVETKTESYYKDFSTPAIKYNFDGPNRVFWTEETKQIVKSKCTHCNDGNIYSEETRICSHCNGNKTVKCSRCNGYGTLVNYFQLCQRVYSNTLSRYLYTKFISLPEFKVLQTKISNDYWNTVDSYLIYLTEFDKCNASGLPLVGDMVSDIFKQVSESEDTKVSLNRLVIDVCPAYFVKYAYNNKIYHCLVLEKDYSLFLVESPITDFLRLQKNEVVRNVKKNNISAAWSILKKINKSKHSTKDEKEKLDVIEGRMKDTSRWGIVVGSVISIVLLLPLLIEYLAKVNFIASWTNLFYFFINPYFEAPLRAVVALGLVAFFVYSIEIPKMLFLYKSGFVRFLTGVFYSMLLFLFSIPIILIVNWLGLLQLFISVISLLLLLIIGSISFVAYCIIFIVALIKY
ncbi:MAG: hypothetical protein ACI3ZZ_04855 [Candidatus Aphodosoma sp.]